ncbi:MAG: glycosyltransferase [Candidatus Komeilibacteria bacterium]
MKPADQLSILMISLDDGLLIERSASDVRQRHQAYAARVARLDIVVLGGRERTVSALAANAAVYSTGPGAVNKLFTGWKIAARLLRQRPYDLIDTQDPHATGLLGWWLKKKFQLPLEVHLHGDFIGNRQWLAESWKNQLFARIQSRVLPRADIVRVVSDRLVAAVRQLGVAADKIVVINTPVDVERFSAVINKPESAVKTLLFVGRLVAAKNLDFMLRVMAELRQKRQDFNLSIIGSGPLEEDIKRQSHRLGLDGVVFFQGDKTPEQLVDYYQQAYLLLLLSTNESFGKVIIEAGAAGVATVASATLGAGTIIEDGQTGVVVPLNDLSSTVEVIDRLLTDKTERDRLGQMAARQYRQRFDRERNISEIINLWQKLAENNLS